MSSENTEINTPDIKVSSSDPLRVFSVTEPPIEKPTIILPGEELTGVPPSAEELAKSSVNLSPENINTTISQAAETLTNINLIKDQLCKLTLDTCEFNYINTNVNPLVNMLFQLASASSSLAISVNYLTISPVVHAKKSELKDTLHLVYNINEECEEVFKVIKHRINKVLKD